MTDIKRARLPDRIPIKVTIALLARFIAIHARHCDADGISNGESATKLLAQPILHTFERNMLRGLTRG